MEIKNPFKRSEIDTLLEGEIEQLLVEMNKYEKSSQEYAAIAEQMTKLYELRNTRKISNDTLAAIAANIAGIIVLMNHERTHVIASKALGLVRKMF